MNERTRHVLVALSIPMAIAASAIPFLPGDVIGWERRFVITTLIAPVIYTLGVAAVWWLTKGSRHVLWLLFLAPLAFWRAAEYALVMVIWTLRGGMV